MFDVFYHKFVKENVDLFKVILIETFSQKFEMANEALKSFCKSIFRKENLSCSLTPP